MKSENRVNSKWVLNFWAVKSIEGNKPQVRKPFLSLRIKVPTVSFIVTGREKGRTFAAISPGIIERLKK